MNLKNKIFKLLEKSWFFYLLFFLISITLFSWLQADSVFFDPDSFYHAKISQLIFENGIIKDFPWQQYTSLKNGFTDHHLLYHLMLVPFLFFFKPLVAVKAGTVLLSSGFVLFFGWYLRKRKIKYAWFYLFVLLTSLPFLIRLSLPKATPLALLLLFLGIYFIEQKKYFYLFLISFLYVWSHGGFILLFLIAGLFFIIEFLISRKFLFYNLLAVFLGTATGLIINPYFPKNLKFYWQQVIEIGLINYKDEIAVGAEWYGYSPGGLAGANSVLLILIFLAFLIFIFYIRQQKKASWQWFFLMLFFLIATLRSRRFVEYFVPVAIMFSAYVFSWFLQSEFFEKNFNKFKTTFNKEKKWATVLLVYFLLTISFSIFSSVIYSKKELSSGFGFNDFKAASNWLANNTTEKEIIFHTRWDEWPQLFFHNTHNYYIVGLDPTFMYNYDRQKFNLWTDLGQGKIKNNLASIIKNNFKANYIFINKEDKDSKPFNIYLQRDEKIEQVYEDEITKIYKIK